MKSIEGRIDELEHTHAIGLPRPLVFPPAGCGDDPNAPRAVDEAIARDRAATGYTGEYQVLQLDFGGDD